MKRILIVEDEAIAALDLKYALEDLEYEVIDIANNGHDAIDIAAESIPDLVLMDIKLKGDMGGIEAADVIAKLRIPIIYLTGNTDEETFNKANIHGSYGFLTKPYEINKLDKTLKIGIKKAEIEIDKLNKAHGFED